MTAAPAGLPRALGEPAPLTRRISPLTLAAGGFLIAMLMACFGGTASLGASHAHSNLAAARTPPGRAYCFGTDLLGRSVAARCLVGGAVSLTVGLAAAAVAVVIGVVVGSVAGWLGGRVDAVLMRIVDVLYGLPFLLLVMVMSVGLGELLRGRWGLSATVVDVVVVVASVGAASWLTMARVVRAQVRSLRRRGFVDAARVIGASPFWNWRRHILPNLTGTIVVYGTLSAPQAILQEAMLGFLGLGIQPPLPSWGTLAAEGVGAVNNVESLWWLLVFPCGMLTATLLALNLVGDALRDLLDPRTRMPA